MPEPTRITLHGDVGYEITPAALAAQLRGVAADAALTVSLHSYGGDALAGIAVHNMLARHKGPKTVVVEGIAASAASLIAMAGDTIVMPDNAFLMIHNAWGLSMGDADTLRGTADVLDQVSGAYRRTYAARTGLDEASVTALMDAETWMIAADAVAKGFATEVAAPVDIQASADKLARFTAVPAALRARVPTPANTVPATVLAPPAANKEGIMPDPTPAAVAAAPVPVAAVPPVATPPAIAPASLAQLQAIVANSAGRLDGNFIVAQQVAGASIDQARDAAINALATQAPATPVVQVLRDAGDTLRARLSGAFSASLTNRAPTEAEREYAGAGFHAIIRELLVAQGVRNVHRMGPDALASSVLASGAGLGHTSSDFAGVLANSTNKAVRDLYGAYPNTWSAWTNEDEYDDFKTITVANVGQFPEPLAMLESGPVTFGTIAEETETFAIAERGRLVGMSRVMLINDDKAAFQRIVAAAALGAYTALRRAVFGVLTTNAAMADTIALFNASHNNLGTAGNLSAASFGQLRSLLFNQTMPARAGQPAVPLPPPSSMVLLVGGNEERTANELVSGLIQPTAVGGALPNSFVSMTQVIADGFLTTGNDPYYLARTDIKPLDIAYLRGGRAPMVSSAERIDYTGVTFRVLFDFGVKATTWRTIAANLG